MVTLNRDAILAQTIPSKVQAYLAAGRPIIGALDGAGAQVIRSAGAGLVCAAEDSEGLADCIGRLHAMDESERDALAAAGRRFYLEHYEITRQVDRLMSILSEKLDLKEKV